MSTETFKPDTYARKSFPVEAVQISSANMERVAKWCGGVVESERRGSRTIKFIKVEVTRATNERQKRAYVGDWVLCFTRHEKKNFKCYTPQAFDNDFEKSEAWVCPEQDPLPGIEALAEKYQAGQV